jgi:hypothetical protein
MSNKILTLRQKTIVDIADAIRNKTGSSELIKIEDLDDAIKRISGGNGGGVIEVDELPKPTNLIKEAVPASTYIVDEDNNWTVTSEPVSCNKVYFNTSLSVEETITEIKKVTKDLDVVYGEMAASAYVLEFYNENKELVCGVDFFNMWDRDENNNASYSDQWEIYAETSDASGTLFNSAYGGWAPNFNGELNLEGVTEISAYIAWNSDVFTEDNPYINPGVINLNSEIVNLIYTGEEVPNPKFDAEAIYKLPDETLWMWSVEAEKFVQLHKEQKFDVMKYSKYNNPEFGFYYGQIFMLDDPITIDIKPILEYMNANDASDFRLLHTINYSDEANPFSIDIPIDTGRSNDSIDLSMGYNKLTITFCYGYMDENGEFIRWSKDPNTNSYSGFGMYVASNSEPYSLIEYEQVLDFNNMSECNYALANGMTFTVADVIRSGAERYENVDLADYTKWSRQFCMVSFTNYRGECVSYPQQNEWNQESYEQD